jgi:hypothetical protein
MTLTEALAALDGKTLLGAEDALALRQIIFADGALVSEADADALFKLNADAGALSPEWRMLFCEALADYVVHQSTPPGYVEPARAEWLIAAVSRNRRLREDEVEMLIHVLEEADQTPQRLSTFILGVVKAVVLWRLDRHGSLLRADVERLRRVVFAEGGDGAIAVTRAEAEVLFDINDELKSATVDPAWRDLFVKAVANTVLFKTAWTPDAAEEIHREAWLEDTTVNPLARLEALSDVKSTKAAIAEGFRELFHWDFNDHALDKAEASDEALEADAEAVTADEARWLAARIGRNGTLDANERALIAFIDANARTVDPTLQALVTRMEAQPAPDDLEAPPSAKPVFGHRQAPAR